MDRPPLEFLGVSGQSMTLHLSDRQLPVNVISPGGETSTIQICCGDQPQILRREQKKISSVGPAGRVIGDTQRTLSVWPK